VQSTIIVAAPEPGAVVTSTETMPAVAEPADPEAVAVEHSIRQSQAPTGWLIQIGAFDSEAEARQHLSEAQRHASTLSVNGSAAARTVAKR
jgi:cell division septation protein DedD